MSNDLKKDGMDSAASDSLKVAASEYGLDYIDHIETSFLDPDLVVGIPVEWSRSNAVLPAVINGVPSVLLSDPDQVAEQDYLRLMTGKELSPVLAERDVILDAVERCYFSKNETPESFIEGYGSGSQSEVHISLADDLLSGMDHSPVSQLVNLILLEAVKKSASDIHFEPFESRLRVRYRVDGLLYDQPCPPKAMEDSIISRLKVMGRMDIAEKRLPQDGMARVRVGSREIDIRVSTVPVAEGERVVLRILDRDSSLIPLEILGMPEDLLSRYTSLISNPNGMILVSGPTGSGKTTTLYATLNQLDSAKRNILTIEDPIEYQLDNIGQIQVKPKIGLTFALGLRHILRQDPDVILVGETRDTETAEIGLRSALTGHLVFSTLHTNDAPGAVARLIDMGVEPYLLAACLRGVIGQRLVRRLCPVCREAYTVTSSDIHGLGRSGSRLIGETVYRAKECRECLEGYKGRVGLYELMLVSPSVREMIRIGESSEERLREAAERDGMRHLVDDGVEKIVTGVTSIDEVRNMAFT